MRRVEKNNSWHLTPAPPLADWNFDVAILLPLTVVWINIPVEHLHWRWPGRVSPHSLCLVAMFRYGAIRIWLIQTGGINHTWWRSKKLKVWQGGRWAKGRGRRHWAKGTDNCRGNSFTFIGRLVFCHFYQHFCPSAVFISSLSMSGCATSFPKNLNHIDCVDHVDQKPNFPDYI